MVDRAKKITELTAVTSITNNDVFIVVSNTAGTAVTRKITINNFRNGLPAVVVGIANTSCTGVVGIGNNITANATGYISVRVANTSCTGVVAVGAGLAVNATGHLSIGSNVTVADTLSVTGETYLTGNVYLGISAADNASELIHFYGTIFSNVIPHTSNNYQLGNTTHYWISLTTAAVVFGDGTSQNTAFQKAAVPANAASTGTAGQIAFDSNYIYYCVATNTWKRAALSTW